MKLRTISKYLFAAIAISLFAACSTGSDYYNISGAAQGGYYSVKLRARKTGPSPKELKEGIDSVLRDVDHSLSGYNPGSVLSRFNSGEDVQADTLFADLYRLSRGYWEMTEGAVDVAAGPLFDIWGFGFKNDSLPSDELVEQTRKICGMSLLPEDPYKLNESRTNHTVLNFNCVAQGYSCDLIADYLRSRGVEDMLINVGGEIYCSGLNPYGRNWTIGIDKPEDGNFNSGEKVQCVLAVKNVPCGVVTSGNYRKFYIKDGRKYSHTIDPRNGRPVQHNLLSATVIAENATLADALATYCMVLGVEDSIRFIEGNDSFEACLIYDDNGEMKTWTSEGFSLLD